ncbi:MAG TPA: hypothetical protein VGE04_13890 [Chloroflexia bacterium]
MPYNPVSFPRPAPHPQFPPLSLLLLALAAFILSACTSEQPGSTGAEVDGCWARVAGPELEVEFVDVTAVQSISANDAWAVGHTGTPGGDVSRTLTMHWDGSEWRTVPSPNGPNPDSGRNSLYAVSASAPDNVWAVGAYTTGGSKFRTLALRWDGSRWSVVPTPRLGEYDDELKAVLAFSPDDVWAVGSYLNHEYEDGHMVVLHWNGLTWTRSPLPLNVTHTLLSIAANGHDDIWAVGTQVLHWNGTNWRILPTPTAEGAYFDGVTVLGKDDVWVVGNDGTAAITLHWNGQKLDIVHVPGPAADAFLHEATVTGSNVWVAGENVDRPSMRETLLMKWTGAQWTLYPSVLPGLDARLQGISAAKDGSLWAAGSVAEGNKSKPLFLRYSSGPCAR